MEIETLAAPARRQSCLERAPRRRAWKRNDGCMGLFHAHSITACKANKRGHGHSNTRGPAAPPSLPRNTLHLTKTYHTRNSPIRGSIV